MKKWICFVLCLSLMALCGCGGGKTGVVPVTKGISFTADMVYYNECYECFVTIDANGQMTARVDVPEEISGLNIICDTENVSAEFKGMTYDFKSGALPLGGVCGAVYDVIRGTWEDGARAVLKDEQYCIQGKNKTDRYTLYFGQTGLPLRLEIPDDCFTVTFKNVTILGD